MDNPFIDLNNSENSFNETIRAELYTRVYKWMSEDFPSNMDIKSFIEDLQKWANSVETRLTKLSYNISTHTHKVQPHYHVGAGPQVGGFTTMIPSSPSSLRWKKEPVFKMIENTTGVKTNLNNKISFNRIPNIGDNEYGKTGREMVIPILKNKKLNDIIIKK